jgi:hypothetical protein
MAVQRLHTRHNFPAAVRVSASKNAAYSEPFTCSGIVSSGTPWVTKPRQRLLIAYNLDGMTYLYVE